MNRFAAPHDAFDSTEADQALRRELYFFTLYRLLEAALLALLIYGPVAGLFDAPRHPLLGRVIAPIYLLLAGALFVTGRRGDLRAQALLGVVCDIAFGVLAMHAIPSVSTGIALMLVFNIASAALLLPLSLGLGAAIAAAAAVVGEFVWTNLTNGSGGRSPAEPVMFTLGFVAIAILTNFVGRQMRASHDLAERRGMEAANLAEVSELIIQRMRTGVLLVDGDNHLRLANEAGMLLLGDAGDLPGDGQRNISLAAPELARRLARWRSEGLPDETPIQLVPDMPEVVPRFTRLRAGSDQTLIFLDDTSLVSRRAESMTLATLGRFSASLAHEIRNPLAAINYAVQLLEESRELPTADRRLLEIIRQQGVRMNGIVENVLGLARREPAQPEHVELIGFAHQFIEEYIAGHPLEQDSLRATGTLPRVSALADPRQLHQVLTALVHNALTYGRMPGQPARVTLHVSASGNSPVIEVTDRGPGIPESIAAQLFRPFFTTSGHGTGLGLYIARELCRANQATLDYVPLPGGGGCFRIRLAGVNALLTA